MYGNGYESHRDARHAFIDFGVITAQIGFSNNLNTLIDIGRLCDPSKDFNTNLNNFIGEKDFYCKPKWKPAKNVKVKSSESCHYIKDGSSEKEIQIVTNFDI